MPTHSPIPDPKQRGKAPGGLQSLVQAEKMMQIALVLPSAAFIGWLGGSWADSHFHQTWIALAGFAFGSAAGMVHVIRLALAAEKKLPADDESTKRTRPGGDDGEI
jgi:Putative F0F1-ATPase subunit Ca2+/Mg2+ transporter